MKRLSRPMALLLAVLMVICSCMTALADQETYTLGDYDMDAFTAGRAAALANSNGGTDYTLGKGNHAVAESMTFWRKDSQLTGDYQLQDNDTFKLSLTWSMPANSTVHDTFTYWLPYGFKLSGIEGSSLGNVMMNGTVIGGMELVTTTDSAGHTIYGVKVSYDEFGYNDMTQRPNCTVNIEGPIDIDEVRTNDPDGDGEIELPGGAVVEIPSKVDGLSITKTASMRKADYSNTNYVDGDGYLYIDYVVTVTALKDNGEVTIQDNLNSDNVNFILDSVEVQNTGSGTITEQPYNTSTNYTSSSNSITVKINEMKTNDTVTIKYTVKTRYADVSVISYNGSVTDYGMLRNVATAESATSNKVSDDADQSINWPSVEKKATRSGSTINWEIKVSAGDYPSVTIKDVPMSEDVKTFLLNNAVDSGKVSVYINGSSSEDSSYNITLSELLENGVTLNAVQNYYSSAGYYTLKFATNVPADSSIYRITNTAVITNPEPPENDGEDIGSDTTIDLFDDMYTMNKTGKLSNIDEDGTVTVSWTATMDFKIPPLECFKMQAGESHVSSSAVEGQFTDNIFADSYSHSHTSNYVPKVRNAEVEYDNVKIMYCSENGDKVDAVNAGYVTMQYADGDSQQGGYASMRGFKFTYTGDAPKGRYELTVDSVYEMKYATNSDYTYSDDNYVKLSNELGAMMGDYDSGNGGAKCHEKIVYSNDVLAPVRYIAKWGVVEKDTVTWEIPVVLTPPTESTVQFIDTLPEGLTIESVKLIKANGQAVSGRNVLDGDVEVAYTEKPENDYGYGYGDESDGGNYYTLESSVLTVSVPSDVELVGKYSYDSEKHELDSTNENANYHFLQIVMKVDDYLSMKQSAGYWNKAQVKINDTTYPEEWANVTVEKPTLISKSGTHNAQTAPYAHYTIEVNKEKLSILGDEYTSLTLADKMSDAITFENNTLKVSVNGASEVDIDSVSGLDYEWKDQTLTITGLQDETHYKFSYKALINLRPGTSMNNVVKNTATLKGTKAGDVDVSKNITGDVQNASGNMDYNEFQPTMIRVYKTDEDTGMSLAGAKFKLYESTDGTSWTEVKYEVSYNGSTESRTEKEDVTLVSGADGYSAYWTLGQNKVYKLVETEAPEGYVKSDAVKYFAYFRCDATEPDWVNQLEGYENLSLKNLYIQTYSFTNKAGVQNGTLSISKTVTASAGVTAPDKEFTFAVELKNGDEALDTITTYKVGEEVKHITDGKITLKAGETAIIDGIPAGSNYTVTETDIPVGFAIAETDKSKTGTIEAGQTSTAAFTNIYTVADLTITKIVVGTDAPETDEFTFTVELKEGETALTGFQYKIGETGTLEVISADGIKLKKGESATITGIPVGATYTITETAHADYTTKVGEVAANVATGTIAAENNAVTFTNTYKYGSLKITKSFNGCTPAHGETFVFDVKDASGKVVTQVVLTGEEAVTVHKLEVGNTYTVSENNAWTWRYTADQASKSATISASEQADVSFTNTRSNSQWLDDSAYADNNFNGSLPKQVID